MQIFLLIELRRLQLLHTILDPLDALQLRVDHQRPPPRVLHNDGVIDRVVVDR